MDDLHIGTQSVRFDAPPSILSFAAIGGKKEQEGPLASYFDFLSSDTTFGQAAATCLAAPYCRENSTCAINKPCLLAKLPNSSVSG